MRNNNNRFSLSPLTLLISHNIYPENAGHLLPKISSINKISASTLIATENANRIYIPEEYVRMGLSINSPSSENSIILSNRWSISLRVSPKIEALKYMFSRPVKS